jgi:hypothetical protein
MERNTMHYAYQELSLEALLANDSSPTRNEKAPAGDMDGETRPELDGIPGSPAIKQSSFGISRDYSFAEESYEDWSFVEKRPYDSLVRESLLDVFNTLEYSSLIESKPSFLLRQVSNRNDGAKQVLHQAQGYSPLEEQLMSDDIQQVYASRLHFQQKVKWFYGLLTTSSLNRHIFPYNTQRGLRSKKLMGFSFLSELEKRFDVQLYRLG